MGHVLITVRNEEGWVVTEVRDDGPGVPAADAERIFERFTRLDDARSRDAGGSGLGLAIARDLAHCHHGSLTLTGRRPGASFVLRLRRASGPGGEEGQTAVGGPRRDPLNLLRAVRNSLDNTSADGER